MIAPCAASSEARASLGSAEVGAGELRVFETRKRLATVERRHQPRESRGLLAAVAVVARSAAQASPRTIVAEDAVGTAEEPASGGWHAEAASSLISAYGLGDDGAAASESASCTAGVANVGDEAAEAAVEMADRKDESLERLAYVCRTKGSGRAVSANGLANRPGEARAGRTVEGERAVAAEEAPAESMHEKADSDLVSAAKVAAVAEEVAAAGQMRRPVACSAEDAARPDPSRGEISLRVIKAGDISRMRTSEPLRLR